MTKNTQTDTTGNGPRHTRGLSTPCVFSMITGLAVLLAPGSPSMLAADDTAVRDVLSDLDCVVEPSQVVELSVAASGLLSETYYERSDFVSAGTLMASLDSGVEHARLAIAEELARSQTALEQRSVTAGFGERTQRRNEQLRVKAAISEQSLDQVRTETRVAQLQLQQEHENRRLALLEVAQARALLQRTRVISPIDGTVTAQYKSSGEYVDGEPIFQIAQLDPLHVEVIVPVDYLGQLEAGMQAGVILDAPGFDTRSLSASIRSIDAMVDAASATYGVRLVLDNPDLTIPSGVRCRIDFFAS